MEYFTQPILLMVFNRPNTTKIVFEQIKKIKPKKLYIAADGPRNYEEKQKCKKVREIVAEIDWECEIFHLFNDENKGSRVALSSAINWFFDNEEMGIILEDDCVPISDFFHFCNEMLNKYKNNENIMQVCGYNALKKINTKNSYIFSKYGPVWGWASWKRAWQYYDVNISDWPEIKKDLSNKLSFDSKNEEQWRIKILDKVYQREIDTCWDYQWAYCKLKMKGLSIIPKVNLIQNIGYGQDATHTKFNFFSYNKALNLDFPLVHPKLINRDSSFDRKYFKYSASPGKIRKATNIIKGLIIKHVITNNS